MESEPLITEAPSNSTPHEVWVRYKLKENEFEAKGLPEDVKPHAMAFLAVVSNGNAEIIVPNEEAKQIAMLEGSDKPVFADTSLSENSKSNGVSDHSDQTLSTFYLQHGWDAKLEKSILTQHQQIEFISYHNSAYQNVEVLHLEDYRRAYDELAGLPVKMPANITARLNELVAQEVMRKVGDGFSLTHKGKQAVQKLITSAASD